ncbi:hypothetical protein EFK50_02650 [Nocardioides marmoriginsengisoli]|uniref:Uncharacterized protein n=1 Tax=Nocardioides marmoriginsengisoli TaxID=661483 RepID=A0A3N0CNM1_9ACTN|nr:hypothetical protein [Nocardioides marmoriginsengisoli]RNL64901.1 hypothetical protein EFK50_02650 [Nocardioides marmoriginsengisoli]
MTGQRLAELQHVVDAGQRAAGVLAARARGDRAGAGELLQTFADDRELATGALLVAELTLGLYGAETGRDVESCVRELNLQLEQALAARE